MNWYNTFYWLSVADGVKSAFDTFSNILTFFSVIGLLGYVIASAFSRDKGASQNEIISGIHWQKIFSKFFWISFSLCIITWIGYMATPTKKDALLIIAGGATMEFLSNDSSAKKIPSEVLNYIVVEIRNEAKEANVNYEINTQKEKAIDGLKNLTSEQLIEKIRTDTSIAKLILQR